MYWYLCLFSPSHISYSLPFLPVARPYVLISFALLLLECIGFFVGINKGCAEWEWGYFYSYVSFFPLLLPHFPFFT